MLSNGRGGERFGGVLINARGQLLLSKSDADFFGDPPRTFVKGPSKHGEPPDQTALRLIYEETGYHARIISALGNYDGAAPEKTFFLMEPTGRRVPLKKELVPGIRAE